MMNIPDSSLDVLFDRLGVDQSILGQEFGLFIV